MKFWNMTPAGALEFFKNQTRFPMFGYHINDVFEQYLQDTCRNNKPKERKAFFLAREESSRLIAQSKKKFSKPADQVFYLWNIVAQIAFDLAGLKFNDGTEQWEPQHTKGASK